MKTLLRIIVSLVILFLVIITGVVLNRNTIIKRTASSVINRITGLTLEIGKVDVGIFRTAFDIRNLKLLNPVSFPERMMVDMPELSVEYDLKALLSGKMHLRKLNLELNEIMIVKDSKGVTNLEFLKPLQKGGAAAGQGKETKAPDISIDNMRLDIQKVVYKDFSQDPKNPQVSEFEVNIHKEFSNIANINALVGVVVVEALKNTAINTLLGADINELERKMTAEMKGLQSEVTQAVGDTLDNAQKNLEKKVIKSVGQATGKISDTVNKIVK